jgi:hypothetical protein
LPNADDRLQQIPRAVHEQWKAGGKRGQTERNTGFLKQPMRDSGAIFGFGAPPPEPFAPWRASFPRGLAQGERSPAI